MKRILMYLIIILIVILAGTTVVNGFHIGNLQVLGVKEMKKENDDLDKKIEQATKLASTDYQNKVDELNDEIKKLEDNKQKYEDLVSVSTDTQVEAANQGSVYMIDFLWIKIENHAKSEGVTVTMNVNKSSSGATGTYDLEFTADGSYVGIEEFITSIEDDTSLGFKIEDFSMTADGSNGEVEAKFTCKDIAIQGLTQTTDNNANTDNRANDGNTQANNTTANSTNDNTQGNTTANNTSANSTTGSASTDTSDYTITQ